MRFLTTDLVFLFGLLFGAAMVVVHLTFAIGIFADASRTQQRGGRTKIVPGAMWAFATLMGGVWVAGVYWFIHHSRFFDREI